MVADVAARKASDNRTVESWLLHYEDRLGRYQAARVDVLESTTPRPDVVTSQGFKPSDQTGIKGCLLAGLAEQEPWLGFIHDFEKALCATPHLLIVLRLRREYRRKQGWVGFVQARYATELATATGGDPADHFKVSRNTFHSMWKEVVDLAAREAIRRGLL